MSPRILCSDIRVPELEYPIYTKMGAGGGVLIPEFESITATVADSVSEGIADRCVWCFEWWAGIADEIHHRRIVAVNCERLVNN